MTPPSLRGLPELAELRIPQPSSIFHRLGMRSGAHAFTLKRRCSFRATTKRVHFASMRKSEGQVLVQVIVSFGRIVEFRARRAYSADAQSAGRIRIGILWHLALLFGQIGAREDAATNQVDKQWPRTAIGSRKTLSIV